jgi:hypothetical protein
MIRPKEYLEHPGFSQSDLKVFRADFYRFVEQCMVGNRRSNAENDATDLGNIIDALTTAGPEALEDYDIVEDVKCSDAIKSIITDVFIEMDKYIHESDAPDKDALKLQLYNDINNPTVKGIILKVARQHEYQKKYLDDTLINTVIEQGGKRFQVLARQSGKPIIDKSLYDKAKICTDAAMTDDHLKQIFTPGPGVKVRTQLMLKCRYKEVDIKSLLDLIQGKIIITEEQKKGIKQIWPYDIKSSDSHAQFVVNYYKLHYGDQGAVYTEQLRIAYPDAIIHPFRFIVIPTRLSEENKPVEKPLIYKMSKGDIDMHIHGGITSTGKKIKGFYPTLEDLNWHITTGNWDYPKAYYDNIFELPIDSFNLEEASEVADYL